METVNIQVAGMSCGGCEDRLAAALKRVAGVGSVSADHETGDVRVLFDVARVDEAQLREQITACGYDPLPSGAGL
jgi:copper chaperone CopZ